MKVSIASPPTREVRIETTLDELVELYQATRRGKRTDAQRTLLEWFGDQLLLADQDLAAIVEAAAEEDEQP